MLLKKIIEARINLIIRKKWNIIYTIDLASDVLAGAQHYQAQFN